MSVESAEQDNNPEDTQGAKLSHELARLQLLWLDLFPVWGHLSRPLQLFMCIHSALVTLMG
jgi:hypothetical protein